MTKSTARATTPLPVPQHLIHRLGWDASTDLGLDLDFSIAETDGDGPDADRSDNMATVLVVKRRSRR